MYQKGDLRLATPPCADADEDGDCIHYDEHDHTIRDSRSGSKSTELPCAFLPHSCNAWVIGGAEQVRALIADLQALLARME